MNYDNPKRQKIIIQDEIAPKCGIELSSAIPQIIRNDRSLRRELSLISATNYFGDSSPNEIKVKIQNLSERKSCSIELVEELSVPIEIKNPPNCHSYAFDIAFSQQIDEIITNYSSRFPNVYYGSKYIEYLIENSILKEKQ